jgi:hypothetical protein
MILRKLCLLAAALYLIFPFVAFGEPTTPTRLAFEVVDQVLSIDCWRLLRNKTAARRERIHSAERVVQADDEPDVQGAHAPDPRGSGVDQYRSLRYRSEGRPPFQRGRPACDVFRTCLQIGSV